MMPSPLNSSNIFTEIEQTFLDLRPSQQACIIACVTSVALATLGLAIGGSMGSLALITGITGGYLSYNSFQVLTNLDNLCKSTAKYLGEGLLAGARNLASGQGSLHPIHTALEKNTVFFDWAVNEIASSLCKNPLLAKKFLAQADNVALEALLLQQRL